MKNFSFLREAFRSFRSTGAIASSSPALVKKLIAPIPKGKQLKIVELGPGDGCVTKALLKKIGQDSEVHAFEINERFIELIRKIDDERLTIIPLGAEQMLDYIEPGSVDYVVSSLPLSMIPKAVKKTILEQSQRVLKPEGQYLQFQYALQDYGLLNRHFNDVKVNFTLGNLPPAFVYVCSSGLV